MYSVRILIASLFCMQSNYTLQLWRLNTWCSRKHYKPFHFIWDYACMCHTCVHVCVCVYYCFFPQKTRMICRVWLGLLLTLLATPGEVVAIHFISIKMSHFHNVVMANRMFSVPAGNLNLQRPILHECGDLLLDNPSCFPSYVSQWLYFN